MADWSMTSIDSLCERVTSGGTPSRRDPDNFDPHGIPWVKTMDLQDRVVTQYDERISQSGLRSSAAKLLPRGTVLMAMYGATVGRLGWLSEDATCNQAACAMVANHRLCCSRWLFYALLHVRDRMVGLANGAAQQNLNARTIKEYMLVAPPVHEQQAIAEVLGALDDKIAANRKVIRLSDELAEMTFREAAQGGEVVPLSSLARFINGKAFTKGATGTGRVVIRIAELNSGLGGSTVRNDIEVADDHVARPGDLLFAWSGSLTVARWFREEAIVNQHIFKVIPDGHPLWLVNQAVRSKLRDYQGIAADKATTMGHIQRRHLDEPVTLPHQETTASLDARMSALWDRALAAEKENEKLATTRDGLLPLLMSGKLRVQDAEKQVGEVV